MARTCQSKLNLKCAHDHSHDQSDIKSPQTNVICVLLFLSFLFDDQIISDMLSRQLSQGHVNEFF